MKQIATKLQRQIKTLNSDKVLTTGGKGGVSFARNMEKDLDNLIEENIRLQNEEDQLMDKVRRK